jgi:hypothetical protein
MEMRDPRMMIHCRANESFPRGGKVSWGNKSPKNLKWYSTVPVPQRHDMFPFSSPQPSTFLTDSTRFASRLTRLSNSSSSSLVVQSTSKYDVLFKYSKYLYFFSMDGKSTTHSSSMVICFIIAKVASTSHLVLLINKCTKPPQETLL